MKLIDAFLFFFNAIWINQRNYLIFKFRIDQVKKVSFIPKYIIKRMIPADGVKLRGDMIDVNFVNVISPISIDQVPDDVLNYIVVKIDDEVVLDASRAAEAEKMSITWQEKVFTMKNFKEAQGQTLPVGGSLIISFPNNKNLVKGTTHKFSVMIKTDNPINIEFERPVS